MNKFMNKKILIVFAIGIVIGGIVFGYNAVYAVINNGNVAIGTTGSSAKLQVNSDIYLGDTVGGGTMTIKPIFAGTGYPAGTNLSLKGGDTGRSDANGGSVFLQPGAKGVNGGFNGSIVMADSSGNPKIIFETMANNMYSSPATSIHPYYAGDITLQSKGRTDANSGNLYLIGDNATGAGFSGGNVYIRGGAATGGGTLGSIVFQNSTNELARITGSGNVGVGTASPVSKLQVKGGYLQVDQNNGAPSASDCNSDTQKGRMMFDSLNNRLYVCTGAVNGWGYSDLIY